MSWLDEYREEMGDARKELRLKLKPAQKKGSPGFVRGVTDAMNAALGGALESGSMAGGAWAGGAAGARTGNPWLTLGGMLTGAAYGGYTGSQGRESISGATGYLQRPSDLPQERQPMAYGGEVIGQGLPFVAAPFVAAARGMNPQIAAQPPISAGAKAIPERLATGIGNLAPRAVQAARQAPTATAIGELGSLGMAGVGAQTLSDTYPGSDAARTAGEIGFGMVHPLNLARTAGQQMRGAGSRVKSMFSEAATREQAGQRLREGISTLGGAPDDVATKLAEAPAGTPTGMATDDPYLSLETGLAAKRSPTFKREIEEAGETARQGVESGLAAGEPPLTLKARAEKRMQDFSERLSDHWNQARKKVDEIAITGDEPRDRTTLSRKSQKIVEDSLDEARQVESQYWNRLRDLSEDVNTPLMPDDGQGVLGTYREELSDLLPRGESLPPVLNEMAEFFGENQNNIPLSELVKFRSKMLKLARTTTDPNEEKYRRTFYRMAEAAENEIDNAIETQDNTALRAALDDARGFSRELHDTFTRTFAGDTQRRAATGEERIAPEAVMRRGFGGGREIGETQLGEMRGAAAFLPDKGFGNPATAGEMRNLQERYLRLMANEKRTPSGDLNTNALRKWMENNQGALDAFPKMRKDLEQAINATNKFNRLSTHYRRWTTPSARKGTFAEVVNSEDPVSVLDKAAKSKTPKQDIGNLVRIAKRSGPGASEGLASTAIEREIRAARKANGELDFNALSKRLNESPVIRELQSRKVINDSQLAAAKSLAKQGENIERALNQHGLLDIVGYGDAEQVEDLLTRIAGAQGGNMIAPGGSNLIVSGASSRFLRNITKNTPRKKQEAILEQAMLDKDFAADLIKLSKTPAPKPQQINKIRAYLWQTGIGPFEGDTNEEPGNP